MNLLRLVPLLVKLSIPMTIDPPLVDCVAAVKDLTPMSCAVVQCAIKNVLLQHFDATLLVNENEGASLHHCTLLYVLIHFAILMKLVQDTGLMEQVLKIMEWPAPSLQDCLAALDDVAIANYRDNLVLGCQPGTVPAETNQKIINCSTDWFPEGRLWSSGSWRRNTSTIFSP